MQNVILAGTTLFEARRAPALNDCQLTLPRDNAFDVYVDEPSCKSLFLLILPSYMNKYISLSYGKNLKWM